MTKTEQQKRFEAAWHIKWPHDRSCVFHQDSKGQYTFPEVQDTFEGWQLCEAHYMPASTGEQAMTERKCVCDLKNVCLSPVCIQEFEPCSSDLNWCCNIGIDGSQCAHDKECHQQREET
jgi:hypothetical protein